MNELPLNRARNPLRNQGYMMRLTGESGGAFMGSLAEELVSEQSMEKDDVKTQSKTERRNYGQLADGPTRRRTNSPTPTRRRIKSSRDVGELVLNPIQLIRS